MRGHANYSDTGADIVCAAVSGIFYSLLGYLANCTEGAKIGPIGHGYADIECPASYMEAMKQTCIGLMQIQVSYPESVMVVNKALDLGA